MSLLADIVAAKRASLPDLERALEARSRRAPFPAPSRSLEEAFRRSDDAPLRLACEHKRKSPSGGTFDRTLDLAARVRAYADAGAALVSVLTDDAFFGGSYDDLAAARASLAGAGSACLVLAKEFVIDPTQVRAASAFGADAVLLVVRLVDRSTLARLLATARDEGLSALVEVVDEAELDLALELGARTIGVNARDLDTLVVDPARAARVLAKIPPSVRALHLSGLKTPEDVRRVAEGRADGALLGEALMRASDPRPLLAALFGAARTPRAQSTQHT